MGLKKCRGYFQASLFSAATVDIAPGVNVPFSSLGETDGTFTFDASTRAFIPNEAGVY